MMFFNWSPDEPENLVHWRDTGSKSMMSIEEANPPLREFIYELIEEYGEEFTVLVSFDSSGRPEFCVELK